MENFTGSRIGNSRASFTGISGKRRAPLIFRCFCSKSAFGALATSTVADSNCRINWQTCTKFALFCRWQSAADAGSFERRRPVQLEKQSNLRSAPPRDRQSRAETLAARNRPKHALCDQHPRV
jgi:hypothetical protein